MNDSPGLALLTGRARKVALTAHVIVSVGWLGAVVAYLALAIAGLSSHDTALVKAAYLTMELVGWSVIVPLSVATITTGIVQALGTEWGLFRHYWVASKFAITVASTIVLFAHLPKVSRMAAIAARTVLASGDHHQMRVGLVIHPAAGLLVLFAATVLSVNKPWGRTPYGKRKQQETLQASPSGVLVAGNAESRLGLYVVLGLAALVVLFAALHLAGIAPHGH
jgi:hypothetical protein